MDNTQVDEIEVDVNFEEIIDKLKKQLGISSDRQFAFAIGMRPDSYANAKKRGTFPYEKIIKYCKLNGISLDELFKSDKSNDMLSNNDKRIDISSYLYKVINDSSNLNNILLPIQNGNKYEVFIDENNDIYVIDKSLKELRKTSSFVFKKDTFTFVRKYDYDFKTKKHLFMINDIVDLSLNDDELREFEIIGKSIFNYKISY